MIPVRTTRTHGGHRIEEWVIAPNLVLRVDAHGDAWLRDDDLDQGVEIDGALLLALSAACADAALTLMKGLTDE